MSEHKLACFGIISILALLSFDGESRLIPTFALISSSQIWLRYSFVLGSQSQSLVVLIGAILFGNSSALTFTTLLRVDYSFFEGLFGFTIASLLYRTAPVFALVINEILTAKIYQKYLVSRSELAVFLPALLLAFTGILSESLGLGRAFWWIQMESSRFDWVSRYLGPVGIDFLVGLLCTTLSHWVLLDLTTKPFTSTTLDSPLATLSPRRKPVFAQDLLSDTVILEPNCLNAATAQGESDSANATKVQEPKQVTLRNPLLPSVYILVFIFLFSYLPAIDIFHHFHPSTSVPDYIYPPVSIACVAPRNSFDRHRKGKEAETTLEDYLHETRVVASRGAKITSWNEGAVTLQDGSGKSSEGNREEGWSGMGKVEREFLNAVALSANQYQIFIAASYILPASRSHSHKAYNLVTLIGPSLPETPTIPNIIYSQTKQHPVPFIESYSHIFIPSQSLTNFENRLPLARIQLPHSFHSPEPKLTPLQEISITSTICLDISYPNLLNSYALVPDSSNSNGRPRNKSPPVILNPSSVPLHSLSLAQIDQVQSRAREQNAFILRCDSSTGISTLVSPKGEIRTLNPGQETWRSFIVDVDIERGEKESWFMWLGGEWGSLGLVTVGLILYVLVGLREEGNEGRLWVAKGWSWIGLKGAGLRRRRNGNNEVTGAEEGRLVDID